MTVHAFPVKPADLQSVQAETDYITQRHECTGLDEFDPVECVPCVGCGHADCRHRTLDMPKPIDTTGMTPAQKTYALRVEADALHAALTATPCEVGGCDCSRMKAGDECTVCSGDGCVEDPRTERTYTCVRCRGYGVIS
jgi:Zn ribbon nucleic-acid-binding protein